jgi:2-isopropylmalate synthase
MITLYDTSLRDGLQGEKINLNLNEKLLAVKILDKIGIQYIEGGFPLANEKEMQFFKKVKNFSFKNAKIVAFGSTRRPLSKADDDKHMQALLKARTSAVTIVGKTWTKHVNEVLKTNLQENLNMIADSVGFLKKKKKEVIYDAEHFFDGFKENPDYAIQTLKTALDNGADWIVVCDTNGGIDYHNYLKALERIAVINNIRYGVHLHNDTESAVAFSMIALDYGAKQIQGTINGWGERCGNTNLISVIANIHFKTKHKIFTNKQISNLTYVSRYFDELSNNISNNKQAYVGKSAFSHKAGQHADVIAKNSSIMEHIDVNKIGNSRRILLSELAGKSTILFKMERFGKYNKNSKEINQMIKILKEKEQLGFEYEAAEASFELLIRKQINLYRPIFDSSEYRVNIIKEGNLLQDCKILAFIRIIIGKEEYIGDSEGTGPVGALDHAFRKAIDKKYPLIKKIKLDDYKVRVLSGVKATDSQVRVVTKSSLHTKKHIGKTWGTVGVSANIIEASWQALKDSFDYAFNEFDITDN